MSTSKGKRPVSTNDIEAYNKEQLAEEIRKLTTVNAQLMNDKLRTETTNAKLEADKNRLINEKNTFVAKRKKLQTKLIATRTIPAVIPAIANSGRDKLKAKRPLPFNRAKKNFQPFFTRTQYY
jgi:hypothetical protein